LRTGGSIPPSEYSHASGSTDPVARVGGSSLVVHLDSGGIRES